MTKFFPTMLIVLDLAASVVWFSRSNWRMGVYWFAAAVLSYVITY